MFHTNYYLPKHMGLRSFPTWIPFFFIIFVVITPGVTCTKEFESLLQLPRSPSIRNRFKGGRVLHVGDFGAKGDGFSNDTEALVNAWKLACSLPIRTKILIPANYTFLVYAANFGGPCKTKVSLQISGTIVAPKDPEAWAGLNPKKWLYFHGINHLTVEGGGNVNGMGQQWWERSCKFNESNPCRHAPTALTFHRCKNLRVQNLRVTNSQKMHIAFTRCHRVRVSNATVIAPAYSPNTDGIHISASHGVVVMDSTVKTGDDCISIVSNSSKIRINNIICGPGHGISIGSLGESKSWEQVQDVTVSGVSFFDTYNGVRIKTWQGGKGYASNIRFQNLHMKHAWNPIIIDQYYCDSQQPCQNQTSAVRIKNIWFESIKGTSASKEAISFACSDDAPCEQIYMKDVVLRSTNGVITESFCWKAYGSSSGLVYPPPCLSHHTGFIEQNVLERIKSQTS